MALTARSPPTCTSPRLNGTFIFGTYSGCLISIDQPHLGRSRETKGMTRRDSALELLSSDESSVRDSSDEAMRGLS